MPVFRCWESIFGVSFDGLNYNKVDFICFLHYYVLSVLQFVESCPFSPCEVILPTKATSAKVRVNFWYSLM